MQENLPRKAACIGGGVIGAGWVARLLLAGVDVSVFDPAPDAERVVREVLANAEHATARLISAPLPPQGTLSFASSIEAAVEGADFIQESVPERLDLKRRILGAIDAAAPADALIGSSTSGLLPTDLQAEMSHPGRLFVAHPFNPVYLLPLVELVAGGRTAPESMERAVALYGAIGMKPVVIRREIEAFVGDRLLEALWREALWLVNDDVATTEEIDDIIRYSFGLRWAQMGLFETYRIAGGEPGMRHFLAQFGPALKWPWTKLMDVPDLDDAFIEKIASQSDEQAQGRGVRTLERIRDDNLVGIIRALAAEQGGKGWGAGALLREHEARLRAAAEPAPAGEPLRLMEGEVDAAWIDYNGHMTESRYLQVFGETTDALLARIGAGADYVAGGRSFYTVETHIRHLSETKQGEAFHTTTQILGTDAKRIRVMHRFHGGDGTLRATAEQMLLHVDMGAGRASRATPEVLEAIAAIAGPQRALPIPPEAGRGISDLR
ncbi:carnitine 3-dehydrogenase [Amaricoccus macauensis]|uniref:L-carnitine dehydrogenase n=1 Tax=Amaricoccus macauensis TaxID=57001 RepID=A0A840SSJ9_9RHOB|nr:carnitine 3-dehydrogenase [Amaricoccus macauensis]MBB5222182.1 carnitine 3-dehydrogenase [Amaricoccus macauensis]